MARNNSRKRGRDTSVIANATALPLALPRVKSTSSPLSQLLRSIEDRRLFHPEGDFAPARSYDRSRHRLTLVDKGVSRRSTLKHRSSSRLLRDTRHLSGTKAVVAFSEPDKVLICVRRSRRREVLHALKKTGKRGQRRPRRNFYSKISCRR